MDKSRQIIGELQDFFKYNDASKAVKSTTTMIDSLTIQPKTIGPVKNPNCKIADFMAFDPFELTRTVISNSNQIETVKQAFDRLESAGAAA